MTPRDFAFPFRIDPASRTLAHSAGREAHVEQMIRQVLLTSPGERVNLPEFGCGLRRLLFSPNSEPLVASVQLSVQTALERWLSPQISVQRVDASSPSPEGNELLVRIEYVLKATLATKNIEVVVR